MKTFFLCFILLAQLTFGQTIQQCRQRFDTYLNFNRSLNNVVKFESEAIYIFNLQGKKEFAFYADEIVALAHFFENSTYKQQESFIKQKGVKHLSKKILDSLLAINNTRKISATHNKLPLQGIRIAIDAGHFGTDLREAEAEKKYLYFAKANGDTVKLFESVLTFNTALILKKMLEEQGAEIFLTRAQNNYTSFNCTFTDWLEKHKQRTLDSMKAAGKMPPEKYNKLKKANARAMYLDFFKDHDLINRAKLINQFNPHATVIIHYNVDEKNVDWIKTTPKNFTMAFIGGGFTSNQFDKSETKINFIRLLLTNQLERSENISASTVSAFHKNLNIPVAEKTSASYLNKSCVATKSAGVFCRNLALCRKINSVLVYGESLYQDNENEAEQLMKNDVNLYGIQTNARVVSVAKSYYEAIMETVKK
ncbi:MAG: N-acetylmuramoyl-L-alanine amidase [Bacteroidetes bacterium]|nr:N-acetylmuramoyl-L-alanine amidase [Bacteroidota bacterium]